MIINFFELIGPKINDPSDKKIKSVPPNKNLKHVYLDEVTSDKLTAYEQMKLSFSAITFAEG